MTWIYLYGRFDLVYRRFTFLCAILITANLFFFSFMEIWRMNRAQRLASAPWCLLGSFWPPLTASHLEIYLSTLRSRLMMETAKVFLINMFFFPLMYSNNKAFSIPMLCINYVFFFFFQIRGCKRSYYTQTTTLTLKQKRVWKSSTTMTWLWSSWRRTFRSRLLSGENSWF